MAAKKKSTRSKPTPKKTVKRAPAPKRASPKKAAPKKKAKTIARKTAAAPKPRDARAALMAEFSKQVVAEEEEPVAVRTFNEARAGVQQSKTLDVRSGDVEPTTVPHQKQPSTPRDIEDEVEKDLEEIEHEMEGVETSSNRSPKPMMEPLAGQASVPRRPDPSQEEFQVGRAAKKGKKGAPPTKEEFGKIELRMQRGSGDQTIARANPDYLQRSFNKAAQSGKVAATGSTKGEESAKADEFHVAMDRGQRRVEPRLSDFGDVEIAQQTRGGRKAVGKLNKDDEGEDKQE